MLDLLRQLLARYGVLVVGLTILIECLGVPLPGETVLLLAGAAAGAGTLSLRGVILAAALGAIVGDTLGYEIGRHGGRPFLERYGRRLGVHPRHLARADAFFARHGDATVFFGRFVALLRVVVALLAGANRMPYRRFLLFNASGGVLWALAFGLLGAAFGNQWPVIERWAGRAGLLFLGVLALAVLGLLLWRWLVQHEAALRVRWEGVRQHPRVAALAARFARQIAFLQARLSPEGYLGLHLTLGLAVIIAAGWLFGGIAEDVVHRDPLVQVDLTVSQWLHAHAEPPFTLAMLLVSLAGYQLVFLLSMSIGLFWLARRRWGELGLLLLAVGGGGLLNLLLKALFARQRPVFTSPIELFRGTSFPSGHAMGAALFYGLAAYLVVRATRSWRLRTLATLAAAFLILLVGFSRVYLGAHYLSDVLGAYAAALTWLGCTITGAETLRRYRAAHAERRLRSSNPRRTPE